MKSKGKQKTNRLWHWYESFTNARGEHYTAGGLNPRDGFLLRSRTNVWVMVVGIPALFTLGLGALVAGYESLNAVLAIGLLGLIGLTTVWVLIASFVWFLHRGWADAIMAIEHKRRQEHDYHRRKPAP